MRASRQRILRATSAVLSWQPQGSDGEPADPGTVTVGVTSADGTVVKAASTATSGATTNPRTVAVTAAQIEELDRLKATWTASGVDVAVTYHDIVGRFYFDSADMRAGEPSTADPSRDTLARLLAARDEIETLVEDVCSMAFVPRFDVHQAVTNRGVVLLHPHTRRIRWVNTWVVDSSRTAYTSDQVAQLSPDESGVLYLGLGYPCVVEVGYEHGLDRPPSDLGRAVLTAARAQNNMARSGIPDRATSHQLPDGGSVTLATPGVGKWHTGIPVVDDALARYNQSGPSLG